ncbi:unnamed protein product [Paramecium sonneborni]|uniref:Mini antigen n=1 Tax=Paramecium sonneborni TaxID=65129 RepID=A0A8S1N7H7_9CILI|nr:unnamed protein product [Paramecium sonneborni]
MKIILIAFYLLALASSLSTVPLKSMYQCSCVNAMVQTDCLGEYCVWDSNTSKCSNRDCTVFLKDDCEGVPDTFNCIWNSTSNKCESFKKCSDYTFTLGNSQNCNEKLIKCEPDLDSIDSKAGTIKCKDSTQDAFLSIDNCNYLPYDACYWFVTPNGQQCLQNKTTEKCEPKTITKCSDYTSDNCNLLACYWNGTICTELTCSIIPEDECYWFYSVDLKSVNFCSLNGSSCVDLDVSALSQTQCLESTFFTYAWNTDSKKCEICVTDSDSNSNMILYGSILLAMILLQ